MDQKELKKLFKLAGLSLPKKEAERAAVAADLKELLLHFQKIQVIDTKEVSPLVNPLEKEALTVTAETADPNPQTRKDKPVDFPKKEAALAQAPEKQGRLIKVPLVT